MANKIQKPCRVCGKMFTPCADCENDKTMFRWKKFTCSLDCAKEYFAKIEESRQQKIVSETIHNNDTNLSDWQDEKMLKPKRGRKKNIENEEREQID